MMLERRNHLRRKLCGGAVVGALAAALCALTGWALLWARAPEGVRDAGGAPSLLGGMLGLYLVGGTALGAALGALQALVEPAVDALTRKRQKRPRAAAMVYSLLLAPVSALVCQRALSPGGEPWAHGWPSRGLLAAAASLVVVVLWFVLLWLVGLGAARVEHLAHRGEGSVTPAALAALALVGASTGLRALDASGLADGVLRASIDLLSFAVMMLAVCAASIGTRAGQRRWGRLAAPRGALAVALIAVTAGAFALARLERPEAAGQRQLLRSQDALVGAALDDA